MIASNPLLGPQWEPLGHVFVHLIERIRPGHHFNVQSYGRKFNLSPDTSPYLQAIRVDEGRLQMEVSGNLMVVPPLTELQHQELEFYGWTRPNPEPDEFAVDEEANPNFVRYFDANVDPLEISEFILTTLVGVYGITEDDFWGFEGSADRVASLKKLGRLKPTPGNDSAVIFAMPGKHLDLVETSDATKAKHLR